MSGKDEQVVADLSEAAAAEVAMDTEEPTATATASVENVPAEGTPEDATASEATSSEDAAAPGPDTVEAIQSTVIEGIKTIFDPEIPVNIWELGLIYEVDVSEARSVLVTMTLTSPMCPTAQMLVEQVETVARDTPHVQEAKVDLVWDPPWDMEKMSEEARLVLGF